MSVPEIPLNNLLKRIFPKIENYPSGSLSKRDIICQIPRNSEDDYQNINYQLTKYIYDKALSCEFKHDLKISHEQMKNQFTQEIQTLLSKYYNVN